MKSDKNQSLYQHFSVEDREFVDKTLEMIDRVQINCMPEVSHFVNPYQAQIIQNMANRAGLQFFTSGDYYPTELVRVLVAPDYYQLEVADFELALLEVKYNSKFNQLHHHQILGSLLHQLGIERYILGDILVSPTRAQVFVEKNFSSFFVTNVSKISKVPVQLQEIALDEMILIQNHVKIKNILVNSLRLDAVIGASYQLSRSITSQLCLSGKVKVNYREVERSDYLLGLSDLVSVRGFGRFKLLENHGFSKSGKHKLTVEIIASK